MDITVAYALVPLVDDTALLAPFTTQTTYLQDVKREGALERLPPEESQIMRVSMLDFGADRVVKLCEGYFDDMESVWGASCDLSSLQQSLIVTPVFEEVAVSENEGSKRATTVMLSAESQDNQGPENLHFPSVLELWKCLELCLSGEREMKGWIHEHASSRKDGEGDNELESKEESH